MRRGLPKLCVPRSTRARLELGVAALARIYWGIDMYYLVVVRSFGSYRTGDVIANASEIETVIKSEHRDHVVRILKPVEG